MSKRTYWIRFPRGFANEFDVGVATTTPNAKQYEAEGYGRISRKQALRDLCWQGDAATRAYVGCSVDGNEDNRFDTARSIRVGR